MKRRALLGTLPSLALAGCTSSGPGERVTETTRTTTPPTTDGTTTEPSATPPWIRDLGVPVDDADCPFDGDGVERVVCYPERTDVPLSLTPDSDELDRPADQTTFALENDTEHAFSLNFYDWGLHKRVDDRWYYITPQGIPEPLHTLPAGDTHEWTFAVGDGDELSSGPASESAIDVAGLGGGEYAFETSGWFDSGDHEHRVGLGARFRVKGAPLELTAPEGLSGARDGDTVVVTRDGADGKPTEAFVVARVGEAGIPFEKQIHQHVAEQLVRPEPGRSRPLLRDALAFSEDGVETVRLEEAGEFDPPFPRDERYYFEYRGAIYEAAVESVE